MHDIDPQIDTLIDAYIDETIGDSEFESLCVWLREDATHREAFARKLAMHSDISEWCIERSGGALVGNLSSIEEEADLPTIHIDSSSPLPKKAYASALTYVIEHTFTPKRVAMLATAAALLFVVTLLVVVSGGQDEPVVDPLANTPFWDTPTPAHRPVVATLTDAVGVQWRSDDKPVPMPMGAQLVAYERFTLTHGFAEITTNRGAVALIQAPATFELTDSDNAIRLHQGKLVGKCQTPNSKGFIVHVPDMDVVDLGTEFGVEVLDGQWADVHVFDGSVRVNRVDAQGLVVGEGQIIESGIAARAEIRSTSIDLMNASPIQFVQSLADAQADRRAITSRFDRPADTGLNAFNAEDGLGWAGPWQVTKEPHVAQDLTFEKNQPLGIGLGGYTRALYRMKDNGPANLDDALTSGRLLREYDSFGGVDRTRPHIIRFRYRLDSQVQAIPLPRSQLMIFDGNAQDGEGKTWSLHCYPNVSDKRSVPTRNWLMVDGLPDTTILTNDPSVFDQMIDTGVELVTGETYEFELKIWPQRSEWDIVIRSGDTRYSSKETLGRSMRFRTDRTSVHGALQFEAYRCVSPDKPCSISIDEITIEPLLETNPSNRENG